MYCAPGSAKTCHCALLLSYGAVSSFPPEGGKNPYGPKGKECVLQEDFLARGCASEGDVLDRVA